MTAARHTAAVAAFAVLWTSLAGPALAADDKQVATIKKIAAEHDGIFGFDYGTPSIPALGMAGLTADKTTVSSSLKPFAISLPSLFDGADSQAAALDLIPVSLLPHQHRMTIEDYQNPRSGWIQRAANRFHLSVAGTNGAFADGKAAKQKPSRLAFGGSLSLLDSSDPLLMVDKASRENAFTHCLRGIPNERLPMAMTVAYSLDSATVRFLRSDLWNHTLSADQLATLRRMYGTPPKGEEAKRPTPDARTVEALTYLMTKAEQDGRSTDKQLYQDKLNEAVNPPQPSTAGPSQTVSKEDFDFYAAALDTDIKSQVKVLDEADKMFATDLGYLEAAKMCGKIVSIQAMYRPQLNVGMAKLWRGKPGKMADLKAGGQAVWAGLRFPLITNFSADPAKIAKGPISALMAGGSARYGWHEYLESGDDTTPLFRANQVNLWGGLEFVSETYQLGGQLGWTKVSANGVANDAFSNKGMRWLGSAKVRVSPAEKGIWLATSYGETNGNTAKLMDKTFLLTIVVGPPDIPNLFSQKAKDK